MIHDNVYTNTYALHTFLCDPYLKARFPFYCKAVQEGAASHAHAAGCSNPNLMAMGKTWVLSRLKLSVKNYVSWPENITLKTWIQEPFKFFAPREALGLDAEGNELFRSMAYWVIIDIDKRRPVKPHMIWDYISLSEDRSLWSDTVIGKLPQISHTDNAIAYQPKIMYRDIDSVRHINNISYIEWILDSFDPEYKQRYQIADFEIQFMAECFVGDELTVYSSPSGAAEINRENQSSDELWEHTIVKNLTNETAVSCRARSRWVRKQ